VDSSAAFTDEERARLGRAPLVAATAITLSDPSGPFAAARETSAALKTLLEAARDAGHGEFVHAVAQSVAGTNPLAGFRPDRRDPLPEIYDELRAVNALLERKASREDAAEYRDWIRTAAQRAAQAAVEGGFLGFGGERVSEREQHMLDNLGEIFGAPRGAPRDPSV
jgi:nucleoside-diphosphate-sugar epimerase